MAEAKSSRVDAVAFQADTDGGNAGGLSASDFIHSLRISTAGKEHQRAMLEFLMFTRNLFQTLDRLWDIDSVRHMPLEDDELALEFLSRFNFDVTVAKFNFITETGMGQGATVTYPHARIQLIIFRNCL
jgi:hypothetical protein